jgi:hypothetical protein
VEVVPEDAVVVVVVVLVAAAAGVLAPALDVDAVEPPPELPHAASSRTSGSRTRRFMGRPALGTGWDACHYPDGYGP